MYAYNVLFVQENLFFYSIFYELNFHLDKNEGDTHPSDLPPPQGDTHPSDFPTPPSLSHLTTKLRQFPEDTFFSHNMEIPGLGERYSTVFPPSAHNCSTI